MCFASQLPWQDVGGSCLSADDARQLCEIERKSRGGLAARACASFSVIVLAVDGSSLFVGACAIGCGKLWNVCKVMHLQRGRGVNLRQGSPRLGLSLSKPDLLEQQDQLDQLQSHRQLVGPAGFNWVGSTTGATGFKDTMGWVEVQE